MNISRVAILGTCSTTELISEAIVAAYTGTIRLMGMRRRRQRSTLSLLRHQRRVVSLRMSSDLFIPGTLAGAERIGGRGGLEVVGQRSIYCQRCKPNMGQHGANVSWQHY